MTESRSKFAVAANTMYQMIGRMASSGTTLFISLLLAKRFGPEGYGDFSKITTYVAFFYLLADLGLNTAFLQKQGDDTDTSYRHLMGLRIAIGILAMFFAVGLLVFFPQGQTQGYTALVRLGILLYSVSILSQGIITTANVLFQKHLAYHRATLALIIGSFVTIGLVLLFGGSSLLGTVVIFLAGSIVTAAISVLLSKSLVKDQSPLFSMSHSLSLMKTAFPLSLTLVFNLVYFRVDSIMLTLARSTTDVGIYNFAYKIFELPLVFPTFFMNALFPIFLHEHKNTPEKFYQHLHKEAVVLFALSIATTIGMWVVAPFITVFDAAFLPSVVVVKILSLGIPFFFLSSLTMWSLITLKKRRALVAIYGTSMILNIIANALFIPIYGYVGAAWVTVVGEVLVLLLSALVIIKSKPEQKIKKLSIIAE